MPCDSWNYIVAGKCVFNIQHWFPRNGIHGVIIVVDDGLTKIKKEVAITVITGPRYSNDLRKIYKIHINKQLLQCKKH